MSPAAVGQPAPAPADNRDELRPLSANSMDIAEGKQLAQRFCADCHGPAGISTVENVPNLAGQRSAYLYREMRAYLSGLRGNDTMNGAITYLSAAALSNVAAYCSTFGSGPAAGRGNAANVEVDAVQDLRQEAAAATCAGCAWRGRRQQKCQVFRALSGQEPNYLASAMTAYKSSDHRRNDTMKAMMAPVTDASRDNIALFYALQKPARTQTPAPGNAGEGQNLAAPCAACHGAQGVSGNPATPSLAGQDAQCFGRGTARLPGRHAHERHDEGADRGSQ